MSNQRFSVMESNLRGLSFKLEYITKSKFDTDWHSTFHSHPFTELFYVIDGKGEFLTSSKRFPVKANDLIIVNPKVEHTEVSSKESPLEYIVLGIRGISFSNLSTEQEDIDLPFSSSSFRDEKKEVLHYLNAIVSEATSKFTSYERICHNLLEVLILKLLRHKQFKLDISHTNKSTKDVALMKHYLKTHYHQKITLSDLERLTHLSKYYIAHAFKKEVGFSPIDYLNHIRIDESKILLTTTDYSVSQIAAIVGFSNPSYFSEMFKQQTGLNPSNYRKHHSAT